MKNDQPAVTGTSLIPELAPEDHTSVSLSRQEATLINSLIHNFMRRGSMPGRSGRAHQQALSTAALVMSKLDGPGADPGLPAMEEHNYPEGTTFYQFTTFDMEAFTEYSSYLPATEAVTSYLFNPIRRKADLALLEVLSTKGNALARACPVALLQQRLNVNTSGIAFNRRHPDALVEYKMRRIHHFAPVLVTPPSEDQVLETFIITS